MENYTYHSIEITIESRKGNTTTRQLTGASICFEEGQKIAAICAFLHDLNTIKKMLNKAIKNDDTMTITFCRFDHNSEYGIYNSREATAIISGREFEYNGGVYLEDKNTDGKNNYFLEAGADLLEAFTSFSDASWAWNNQH